VTTTQSLQTRGPVLLEHLFQRQIHAVSVHRTLASMPSCFCATGAALDDHGLLLGHALGKCPARCTRRRTLSQSTVDLCHAMMSMVKQAQEGKSRLVNKPREFDLCPLRSSKAVMQTVPEATSAMTKVRVRVRVRFPMTRAGSLWEHAPSTGNCFCGKPMPSWLQREPDVSFERSLFFRSENFGKVCA